MFEQYIKPALILIAAIVVCAVLARTLSGSETLAEYAEKHPEIAYGGSDNSQEASNDAELMNSDNNDADNSVSSGNSN
ncbi:hypothetical protein [Butyrivibrio sp. AC2005]|uniref:hypothetical protein n=1 Tax=Butyrivibrio sp. AC2005 TaxID=1280672 RepID=UPI0003FA3C45|nr:hypothetical protein [Butyrivibrio sp. AC2005]